MSSISLSELLISEATELSVPQGTEGLSMLDAALAWASCGFYVLPINQSTKHPGSVVGVGWPDKSSRAEKQIREWFSDSDYGLAIHVGRSGAIAFDVDEPHLVPYVLGQWIRFGETPFQSTRDSDPMRGHFLFSTQYGKTYSNSKGYLSGGWGEVRGKNGIIVVSPTIHQKSLSGGRYLWIRTGPLPVLPYDLDEKLPQASTQAFQAVNLAEVEAFLLANNGALLPGLLERVVSGSSIKFTSGSRHDAARNLLITCLTDAMAGLYPAKAAVERIANHFILFKPESEWSSPDEFLGMVKWAVAQVSNASAENLSQIRDAALLMSRPSVQNWLEGQR
jgi:hypothetical protein